VSNIGYTENARKMQLSMRFMRILLISNGPIYKRLNGAKQGLLGERGLEHRKRYGVLANKKFYEKRN
jgi:hypothetical protein